MKELFPPALKLTVLSSPAQRIRKKLTLYCLTRVFMYFNPTTSSHIHQYDSVQIHVGVPKVLL